MIDVVAQAIGVVAAALVIFSFQQKKQKTVIIWQMTGQLLFSLSYIMLGITTGACLNLLGFVRGIVYANREKFRADKLVWVIVFTAGFFLVYLAGFLFFGIEPTPANFAFELTPVLAMTFSTISFRIPSAAVVRRLGLASSPLWLTYNILNQTIGGVVCEIFNLISIVVGIIRLDIKRRDKNEL